MGEGRGTKRKRSQGPKPGVGEGPPQRGRRAEGESGAEVRRQARVRGQEGGRTSKLMAESSTPQQVDGTVGHSQSENIPQGTGGSWR